MTPALAFRETGDHETASILLEESRYRDPLTERLTDYYERHSCVEAKFQAISGNLAEAMRPLRKGVGQWHTTARSLCPGMIMLLLDPSLDSLRNDPLFTPQSDVLIDELDAILELLRQRVLQAERSDDWNALQQMPGPD